MKRLLLSVALASSALIAGCADVNGDKPEASSRSDDLQVQSSDSNAASPKSGATELAGYVHAPGGVFTHKSCVHEIPSGAAIDDDLNVIDADGKIISHFRRCGYPPIFRKSGLRADSENPSTDGWISSTYQSLPTGASTWNAISAYLTVPSTAPFDTDSLNYYFNGLEGSSYDPILQPVLQYGDGSPESAAGKYWSISSYRVYADGTEAHTTPLAVAGGDVLNFEIQLIGTSDVYGYEWEVEAHDRTAGTTSDGIYYMNSANGGGSMPNYFPAVHESYGDNECENGLTFYGFGQDSDAYQAAVTSYVPASDQQIQYGCDNGTSPSCFTCPIISQSETSVY